LPAGPGSSALWQTFADRTADLLTVVAVAESNSETTFAALREDADSLAAQMGRAGVSEGAVVVLALPNSARLVSMLLALCRLDATVALVSPLYGPAELGPIASRLRPACLITDDRLAGRFAEAVSIVRREQIGEFALLFPQAAADSVAALPAALLKFSSGSTSEPKGIALEAANVLAEADSVAATLGLAPGDRVLAGVPLSHSYGFDLGVLQTLYAGTTLVLEEAFVPRRTASTLAGASIAAFLGVPAHYKALLATRLTDAPDLSRVPWLLSCTAPLSGEQVIAFHERFRGLICQHYGSSETGAVTTHVPSEVLRRPDSVGRAGPGVRLRVVREDGTEAGAGEAGEVTVSGPAVAGSYAFGVRAGAPLLRQGAFWMGDIGVLDADGFLAVHGRVDDMINVGGLKVSPAEVASVLERHPAVREAAAVGVPGAGDEVVLHAAVVAAGPVTESELLALCRSLLAEYKVPRRIEFREALPTTASGKVRLTATDLGE
jgi:long-chain acyl-CoA synthetase